MSEPEVEKVVESGPPNLAKLLVSFEGAPSAAQLETWKQQHGELFVSGFSETELFVFRPLSWKEHKHVNKTLATPVEEGEEPRTEFDLQEMVVDLCLLWTSVPSYQTKGGTIPSIFEMIMLNSNFTSPQTMAAFTMRL
jgi:hypothetical protein